MLLKTACQAAKISDKLFLLQISWFQPRLHSLSACRTLLL